MKGWGRRALAGLPRVYSSAALPGAAASSFAGFSARWQRLSQVEKDRLAAEFEPLRRGDWRELTLDQKKMLYTVAYGVPEVVDPKEGRKIAAVTVALLGASAALFLYIRSFANPPPKSTYDEEWQKESLRRQLADKANPVAGLSSARNTRAAAQEDAVE